jgi:hypothetical protein
MDEPLVFTPDNEPYLGLEALVVFDHLIVSALELNAKVATYTHEHELSGLQQSAAQIIPQGLNLSLSIRELVRQGHLFAAAVLLRSLIERAAIMSYLYRKPEFVQVWETGWRYKERPSLASMLEVMHPGGDTKGARKVCETFNHLVHGDPMGAEFNLVHLSEDALGYGVGKTTNNGELASFICGQSVSWLSVLCGMMAGCFPSVARKPS